MAGKKKNVQSPGGEHMNSQTAEMLSEKQAAYQKSEQHNFPLPDKREEARHVHTNGSTRKSSS